MKIHLLVIMLSVTTLFSCSKNNQISEGVQGSISLNTQLGPGAYKISCFHNKPASQGMGSPIYTISTITLNNGDTGTTTFELHDNSSCTSLINSGSTTVLHYETIQVNGENVLLMNQDDGNSISPFWIGYKQFNGSYYMDVDFTDGESGPYMAEPTPGELNQFMANPAGQGILLQVI